MDSVVCTVSFRATIVTQWGPLQKIKQVNQSWKKKSTSNDQNCHRHIRMLIRVTEVEERSNNSGVSLSTQPKGIQLPTFPGTCMSTHLVSLLDLGNISWPDLSTESAFGWVLEQAGGSAGGTSRSLSSSTWSISAAGQQGCRVLTPECRSCWILTASRANSGMSASLWPPVLRDALGTYCLGSVNYKAHGLYILERST